MGYRSSKRFNLGRYTGCRCLERLEQPDGLRRLIMRDYHNCHEKWWAVETDFTCAPQATTRATAVRMQLQMPHCDPATKSSGSSDRAGKPMTLGYASGQRGAQLPARARRLVAPRPRSDRADGLGIPNRNSWGTGSSQVVMPGHDATEISTSSPGTHPPSVEQLRSMQSARMHDERRI